jgi:hypothetical protein
VVQIDHVALGHRQQSAEQIDFGGTPVAPQTHPPQRAKDREGQGSEKQDGKKSV